MRRFRIATLNESTIESAIKSKFGELTNEQYDYDLTNKNPYCQIKDDFYLIVDKESENYKKITQQLKQKIESDIKKQLGKLSKNKFESISENTLNNILKNQKKIKELTGKDFKISGDILFVKDYNSRKNLISDKSSEKIEYTSRQGFKVVKNNRRLYGLRNNKGALVVDFKNKFTNYYVVKNAYIIFEKDDATPTIYTSAGKQLFKDKNIDEVWRLEDIELPKNENLLAYQSGDKYGILDLKTKNPDVIELSDSFAELEDKYNQKFGKQKTTNTNQENTKKNNKKKNKEQENTKKNNKKKNKEQENTEENKEQENNSFYQDGKIQEIKIPQLDPEHKKTINDFLQEKNYNIKISKRRYKLI